MRYLMLCLMLSACMTDEQAEAYDAGVAECERWGETPPLKAYTRAEWRAYRSGWTDAGCEWPDGWRPWGITDG